MVHSSLGERIRLPPTIATITIGFLPLWAVRGIVPSVATFEACHPAQIFLVTPTISMLVAIMVVTIVLAMAIMLPR